MCHTDGTEATLRFLREDGALLGVCIEEDPATEVFRYAIAVEGEQRLAGEEWTTIVIPATTWATFPSQGALPDAIQAVWTRIFREWFPATGYQHTGGPELEICPPGDPLSSDYWCEVWIPVVKR